MKSILGIAFLLIVTPSAAQIYGTGQDIDLYRHQIILPDHRVVFQAHTPVERIKIANAKEYFWYASNRINVTQGGYSGKLLHGDYADFYLNGSLKEQGRFENGLKVGQWKSWDRQGKLSVMLLFKQGVLAGPAFKYDAEGMLIEKAQYQNGKLNGKLFTYFKGESTSIQTYKNGILQQKQGTWFGRLVKQRKNKG